MKSCDQNKYSASWNYNKRKMLCVRRPKGAQSDTLAPFQPSSSDKLRHVALFYFPTIWFMEEYLHKSNIQSFPVLWAFISGFHFTCLFDRQIKAQIKHFRPHLEPKRLCVSNLPHSTPLKPPPPAKTNPQEGLEVAKRQSCLSLYVTGTWGTTWPADVQSEAILNWECVNMSGVGPLKVF